MIRFLWALLMLTLTACGALAAPDNQGTLQAQNDAFRLEATAIRQTLDARDVMVRATAIAAETQVVERNSINQQLLATVKAGDPPTQQLIVVNPTGVLPTALPLPGMPTPDAAAVTQPEAVSAPLATNGQFVDTVTTGQIRDSDGCAVSPQAQFTLDTDRIYIVTRALEVSAGTQIGVEWFYEGQVVDTGSWTVPQNESNFCLWFYLDEFSPGNWSVQLSANGTPISPAPSFTVLGADGT